MPEVGEQIGAENAANMQEPDVAFDREGRSFDPSLHEIDRSTGKPRLSPAGRLIRKASSAPTDAAGGPSAEAKMTGVFAASTFFMLCCMVGGEDWKPTDMEREAMQNSSATVLDYYGVTQIHPVLGLAAVMAMYAQPRLMKPETQGAIARFWWRLRHRRSGAQPDNRNNGVREDHAGDPNQQRVFPNGQADLNP